MVILAYVVVGITLPIGVQVGHIVCKTLGWKSPFVFRDREAPFSQLEG